MADDNDTKRVNVLIPRELYEKFLDFSKDEYKSTTGMIIEWMSAFVKEKEKEAQNQKAFLSAFSRFSEMLFLISSNMVAEQDASGLLVEMATAMLELVKDPSLCSSSDFLSRLILLDQRIKRGATPDTQF